MYSPPRLLHHHHHLPAARPDRGSVSYSTDIALFEKQAAARKLKKRKKKKDGQGRRSSLRERLETLNRDGTI